VHIQELVTLEIFDMNIKRYEIIFENDNYKINESVNGKFVKFDDVKELLKQIDTQITRCDVVMRSDSDVYEIEDNSFGKLIRYDDIKNFLV
jgi:hypothetical protein